MIELIWWIFASLTLAGAVGMVLSKNPIASLLFLVLSFFSIAGIYVLLEAHFIAAIQVIVYAGAIMVLFLFVIMLLNLGEQFRSDLRRGLWLIPSFAATGVFGWFLYRGFGGAAEAHYAEGPLVDLAIREHGVIGAVAFPLFQDYIVAVELTAVLLLAATVGAVLLAKRRV